jgi:hypothetical protein
MDEAEHPYKNGETLRVIWARADSLSLSDCESEVCGCAIRNHHLSRFARCACAISWPAVDERIGFNASTVRLQLLCEDVVLRDPHGRER